jgi:hypothetical protein
MRIAGALLLLVLLGACASEVVREPRAMTPVAPGSDRVQFVIAQDTPVSMSSNVPGGYTRTLTSGSRWQLVGTVPEGGVYRRADGIFTVEGANVHEAYLVVQDNRLVGFYLPVEKAFSPAMPTVLKLQ